MRKTNEFSIELNSGLFSFGGESATAYSFIIVSDVATIANYTNNPYGTQKKLAYGLSAQYRRVTSENFIFEAGAGFDIARSGVEINDVSGEFAGSFLVTGHTLFENRFITIYPKIGYRLELGNLKADIGIGPEIGINVYSREKGEAATDQGLSFETNHERTVPNRDFRIRSTVTVFKNRAGITAGYSYGLTNYSGNLVGANRERYSRFIRFGFIYQI